MCVTPWPSSLIFRALITHKEDVYKRQGLAPAAKLAYEGKGEFKAGDHCQFCKAKSSCRKRAEYNLELARYDSVSYTHLITHVHGDLLQGFETQIPQLKKGLVLRVLDSIDFMDDVFFRLHQFADCLLYTSRVRK